jgi:glycosyltransferase involved in cell wall biosynthesis
VITGLDTGGAEMSLYRLLSRLSHRFNPHVISLSTIGPVGRRIADLGVPVEALGMKPGRPNPLAIIRLAGRLRALNPDIVHTWMYHADLIGGLATRLARVPALTWGVRHSNLSAEQNKKSTLAVVKVCSWLSHSLPDRILSCSEVARDIHIKIGYPADKFTVIPNGIDLSLYAPETSARASVCKELGMPYTTPLIGVIARFDSQKNHEGFIRAAGQLHAQRQDVHFILAGRGVDCANPDISRWLAEARVSEVCHLLGQRDDVPRLMSALDISTSPSWGEAFPNVVAEAMACGVPCVVTDVGDSAYIVGDTGKVIAPGDTAALVDAWKVLLDLPIKAREELGMRARIRVEENFELDAVVMRYQQFYDDLVATKSNRTKGIV